MLNKRERKWLESRKKWLEERGAYSCRWCPYRWEDGKYSLEIIKSNTCSMFDGYTDYKDIALFEAKRVEYLTQAIKMLYFAHPKEAELIIKGCAHYADMKMEK